MRENTDTIFHPALMPKSGYWGFKGAASAEVKKQEINRLRISL